MATLLALVGLLVGQWDGTLQYLDYQDNTTRTTIRATLDVARAGEALRYQFSYVEPNGRAVAGDVTMVSLSAAGAAVRFNNEEWSVDSSNATTLRLSRRGTDNNRPARLERTYTRAGQTLRIRTDVYYEGSNVAVTRNEYALTAKQGLGRVLPESVGLSGAELRRATELLNQFVADRKIAGAVAAVARSGQLAYFESVGMQDLDTRVPMNERSVFRIYSMTRPITAVAAMLLLEEGRFRLDDPISTYLPEFADIMVATPDGPRRPVRPITIADLLLHTSGINDRQTELYRREKVRNRAETLPQLMRNIVRVGLMEDPGTRHRYGESTSVVGRLIEVWSGRPLDAFLEQRIFIPLKMVDTGFIVRADQKARWTTVYAPGPDGSIAPNEVEDVPFTDKPALLEGTVGLVSTVPDFLRFSQMLLNKGELDGVRLLKQETVDKLVVNGLPDAVLKQRGGGMGWALANVNVVLNADSPLRGEYSWDGTAGTIFWVDPAREMITLLFAPARPSNPNGIRQKFKAIVQQAILK